MKLPLFLVFVLLVLAGTLVDCRKQSACPEASRPRIVTFSPALTEMAFDMGLGGHIVGVTTRCNLPDGQNRPRVGDRLTVIAEPILAVEPEVVLVQQDERDFQAVVQLRPLTRIEHFNIERVAEIPIAMERLGAICGRPELGQQAAEKFRKELSAVEGKRAGSSRPAVLFAMGSEAPGTGGKHSFIHDMIISAGGRDVGEKYKKWATLDMESVLALAPEVVVCWVDPGQEERARQRWQTMKSLPAVAAGKVFIVSDPKWTIPSSRLPQYIEQLSEMIHAVATPATSAAPEAKP